MRNCGAQQYRAVALTGTQNSYAILTVTGSLFSCVGIVRKAEQPTGASSVNSAASLTNLPIAP